MLKTSTGLSCITAAHAVYTATAPGYAVHTAPAPSVENILPAPVFHAAPEPVAAYISPAPVAYATPAQVVRYEPAALVVHTAPAPVVECMHFTRTCWELCRSSARGVCCTCACLGVQSPAPAVAKPRRLSCVHLSSSGLSFWMMVKRVLRHGGAWRFCLCTPRLSTWISP